MDDENETAKRIVVDYVDAEEVVQKLRILPPRFVDFTVKQLRLLLQAFGKSKLSTKNKVELRMMLNETLTGGDGLSDPEKIRKVRQDILDG